VLGFVLMYLAYFGAILLLGVVMGLTGAIGEGVAGMLDQLLLTALYPLPATVTVLLYYDLRIRNEAFDITMLMDAAQGLESAPAPEAVATP
jgi:hypothetical protein